MDAAHQQQFDEMLKTQQEKTEQEKQAIKVSQRFDSCLYGLSCMIHAPGDSSMCVCHFQSLSLYYKSWNGIGPALLQSVSNQMCSSAKKVSTVCHAKYKYPFSSAQVGIK